MGFTDLIMFPFFVLLFAIFFALRRKKIDDPILKKYHRQGFWIKVASAVAYVIFSFYIIKGDSTSLYYPEGINITKLIYREFSNIHLLFISGKDFDENLLSTSYNRGYFNSESNFLISRLVTIFSFITFGSYSAISLIFSMISFSGVWRLYRFFYEQYPHLHKRLAIAIIYLPTFVFWSSGILKDPICTGMLGWLTYGLYMVILKRKKVAKYLIIAILAGYVLGLVKMYILLSFLPFLLLFFCLKILATTKSNLAKIFLFFGIIFFSAIGIYLLTDKLKEELGGLALDKITKSVKTTQENFINISDRAESAFTLGVEFDGSTASLIKIAPAAVTATLFRPFLWESKKVSTLLSSMESLALMLFTLYVFFKAGPGGFFGGIIKDPMILFCISFSLLFALFVGATTMNFGTLVRYKVPCMPFYIIALMLILERKKNKTKIKAEKELLNKTAALNEVLS